MKEIKLTSKDINFLIFYNIIIAVITILMMVLYFSRSGWVVVLIIPFLGFIMNVIILMDWGRWFL